MQVRRFKAARTNSSGGSLASSETPRTRDNTSASSKLCNGNAIPRRGRRSAQAKIGAARFNAAGLHSPTRGNRRPAPAGRRGWTAVSRRDRSVRAHFHRLGPVRSGGPLPSSGSSNAGDQAAGAPSRDGDSNEGDSGAWRLHKDTPRWAIPEQHCRTGCLLAGIFKRDIVDETPWRATYTQVAGPRSRRGTCEDSAGQPKPPPVSPPVNPSPSPEDRSPLAGATSGG